MPVDAGCENGRVSKLNIDIWIDIACPFCFIGKRNFEKALADNGYADKVAVTYRSFQLDPEAPRRADHDVYDMLARKTGRTREQAKEMNRHVAAMGEQAGIRFDFDNLILVNTFDAHRVLKLAVAEGIGPQVADSLLSVYFQEGLDTGDPEVLEMAAVRGGLAPGRAAEELSGAGETTATHEVWNDILMAQQYGISAVPAFIFDRRALLSGAQAPAGFAEVLERMIGEHESGTPRLEVVRGGHGVR